ncbi:MAG TPA: NADH-quinone oxidoreductase subunit C [Bacteroidales bacterium]|nr:NADH-quinone oxidoreductase subunit C [Bacteroidales bacterium]HPS49902.1 NADH-quinone oxidoreductase subunit C [Bacteroidales bacterium]
MEQRRYIELFTNPASVRLEEIPVLDYDRFLDFLEILMGEEGTHCVSYFVVPGEHTFRFICCMAADENHALVLFSHEQPRDPLPSIPSITAKHFQFHIFEREIHELTGIRFEGHPWLKPVRYPYDRYDRSQVMDNYPFFNIEGESLHEVGVGPVHAGIIEPGHFRFICKGEEVLHLEIHLGYQHRGVERLFTTGNGMISKSILAESIAGDTAIGHSQAFAGVTEALAGKSVPAGLHRERSVALELERMAVHIGDTAALCTDIAYQFGQVVCEALRTLVINTTQLWCGNRFGKGLVRPGGTNYPLTPQIAETILTNLKEVEERYNAITKRIFTLPSVLGRFEGTGTVTPKQATLIGAVGMAARSSGVYRDIRWSHPFAAYSGLSVEPVMLQKGDVWSRAMLRKLEVEQSVTLIRELLQQTATKEEHDSTRNGFLRPDYHMEFEKEALAISLVEGWRGEICHVALTGSNGEICYYKVKDPSMHNWMALALAVRSQEISDFPLCNKSFNLSYCGNDL